MKHGFLLLLTALFFLTGCQDKLIGTWLPEDSSSATGMIFLADGTIQPTSEDQHFVYRTWTRHDRYLTLKGEQNTKKGTTTVQDEYEIVRLDAQSLQLKIGQLVWSYQRDEKK